jgi:hypothetical protein
MSIASAKQPVKRAFQAMMFRFQAARNLITRHPDEALRSLDAAINDGEQALDDSRNAIQNLAFAIN